jgi:hypothetical protein
MKFNRNDEASKQRVITALLIEFNGVAFQSENIVGENNDLVASSFMEAYQEFAGSELVRIRYIQQLKEQNK